jgi:hypothetical protein
MILINKSDFKGKFLVATGNFDDLQDYIDRYEKAILVDLMGQDLADDFEQDPTDSKWDEVKAVGFGLKSLLVGLVYFQYVRDLPYRATKQGIVYQMDENASQVITAYALRQRYNECILNYKKMQEVLRKDFEDFCGTPKKLMID